MGVFAGLGPDGAGVEGGVEVEAGFLGGGASHFTQALEDALALGRDEGARRRVEVVAAGFLGVLLMLVEEEVSDVIADDLEGGDADGELDLGLVLLLLDGSEEPGDSGGDDAHRLTGFVAAQHRVGLAQVGVSEAEETAVGAVDHAVDGVR